MERDAVAEAIERTLVSPNELDSNYEAANVVDGLYAIARAIHHLARAAEGFVPDYTDEQMRRYDITREKQP